LCRIVRCRRLPDRAHPAIRRDGRGEPWNDVDAGRLDQLALRAAPYEDRLAEFLEAAVLGSETDAYDPRATASR